jgi:hypothetical protein
MKIKKKIIYNWHFWISSYKIQIVVPKTSYCGAVSHLKEVLHYYNRPCPEFKFQFGEMDFNEFRKKHIASRS